jgi:hypothetical protein
MSADAIVQARARGLALLVVLATCAAVVLAMLLASGVNVGEVFLFTCFQIAYALVPGLVLSLALLGAPRPPLERLALAAALGLAAQIGCFVLAAAVAARLLFAVYPLAFAIPALPWLWRRRADLLRASRAAAVRRVPVGAAVVTLLVSAAASFVVFAAVFAPSPLPRAIGSVSYYPDLIANMSLASELLHHWPFMSPSVTGVALHYNIFTNVDMAAAAQVAHVELASIVLRLQPPFLVVLIAVQLFVLGRKVGGTRAAGLAALVLGLFAGEMNLSRLDLAGGGVPVLGGLYSASYQLGAVFFLAILIVLVDRGPAAGGARAGRWLALALMSLAATGAKASVLPVLAGGLALALAVQFATRAGRRAKASVAAQARALVIVLAAGGIGYLLIYRGGGHGQVLEPLDFLSYTGFASVYRRAGDSAADALVAGVAAVLTVCWLSVSLVGAAFVRDRWWPSASCASPERLLLCMFVASLVPFALFAVPGDSELYYLVYGFLAASVVAAAGVTAALRKLEPSFARLALRRPRQGSARPALRRPRPSPVKCTRRMRRGALTLAALTAICLTVVSEAYELTEPTLGHWLDGTPAFAASGADVDRGLTAGLLHGLEWLREHTPPGATIAVNNHWSDDEGDSNYFYYSAFSERRVFLESWEETPQGYEYLELGRSGSPFPRLLALNEAAVNGGSPPAISLLHERYGVDYIVIDRLHGTAAADLSRVCRLVYANPAIAIFRVE